MVNGNVIFTKTKWRQPYLVFVPAIGKMVQVFDIGIKNDGRAWSRTSVKAAAVNDSITGISRLEAG